MEFVRITSSGSLPSERSFFGGNQWFFSVTPFPENVKEVPLSNVSFEDLQTTSVPNVVDVYTPLPSNSGDVPCPASVYPKTFIIFFEMSSTTSSLLLHYFCTYLRAFASKPRAMYLTVVAFGSTIRFPILSNDGSRFSIGTVTDLDVPFPCKNEALYFNMTNQNALFSKYVDEFEKLNVENAYIRVDRVLTCFQSFLRDLRNPAMCILAESPDADAAASERLATTFLDLSLSVDFYCLTQHRTYNLSNFVRVTNGSLQNYLANDCEDLCCDIIRKFTEARVIFTVIDMSYSKSIAYVKILGRGQMSDRHLFRMSKISTNETIHFFARLHGNVPPNLLFIVRFLDSNMHCYRRVIPIDCSLMRSDPEALLAAVAVRIAMDGYDPIAGASDLQSINLSSYDAFFRERFGIAIRALRLLQKSPYLSNFVLTRTPSEILERLSPACLPIGSSEWRTIRSASFGDSQVLVQYPMHHYLVVLATTGNTMSCDEYGAILHQIDAKATFSTVHPSESSKSVEYSNILETLSYLR